MSDPASTMPDDQTDAGAAPADAAGDMGSGPKVLFTGLKNEDGTYQLVEGDEPEAAGEGSEGDSGDGGGKSTTYDSPEKLLHGVLECLKKDQGAGPNSAQANFQAGFSGDDSGSAPKAGDSGSD